MARTSAHPLDSIVLGGINTVRDRLLELQAQGRTIFRLESGDPSFAIPDHVSEAIQKALRDGHTHYSAGAGIKPLREAAARKLAESNGIPVKGPSQVLVTNGAMHGLYIAFQALLDPGDEVIMPDPTWTETADNVTLARGVAVRVRLDATNLYRYAPEAIAAAVTPRTRAIVINSPHNPTGLVIDRDTLAGIVAVAERHGLWILSDEAYEHVLFDGAVHVSTHTLGYDRVLSVFSMSKSYAMSGLRLGYLSCTDEGLVERMTKLLRCTINGVNSATQYGAVAALTGPQDATARMGAEYQKRRDALWAGVSQVPMLHPFKPQGAFYLWARIDERWGGDRGQTGGWAFTNCLIDRAGIGSAPGDVFGASGAGHVRFAFSCATEQVVAAAALLPEVLT
jgi:aspartate/methionine/tyrosine aminotransferase